MFKDIAANSAHGLTGVHDFKQLGSQLALHFEEWWLFCVFPWAEEAVDWDECSVDGMRWAKCRLASECYFLCKEFTNKLHVRYLHTAHCAS